MEEQNFDYGRCKSTMLEINTLLTKNKCPPNECMYILNTLQTFNVVELARRHLKNRE